MVWRFTIRTHEPQQKRTYRKFSPSSFLLRIEDQVFLRSWTELALSCVSVLVVFYSFCPHAPLDVITLHKNATKTEENRYHGLPIRR